jgi:hypothetical protein
VIKAFLTFMLDYGRILKEQKRTDPDPQHWFRSNDERGTSIIAGSFCFNIEQNKQIILHQTKCPPLRGEETKATTVVAQKGPHSGMALYDHVSDDGSLKQ